MRELRGAMVVAAVLPFTARAQPVAASAPAPVASVPAGPVAPKAGKKLLPLSALRDSASPVDDHQSQQGKAVPQISVPLGKASPLSPPSPAPVKPRAARAIPPAASGGVADAAARCEAETDSATRAACRDRSARQR